MFRNYRRLLSKTLLWIVWSVYLKTSNFVIRTWLELRSPKVVVYLVSVIR